ncbi:MAG: glycosyltransferase [Pirellulales bacterium]|nr:glycosyltransferase [Pirellulales bacterium]
MTTTAITPNPVDCSILLACCERSNCLGEVTERLAAAATQAGLAAEVICIDTHATAGSEPPNLGVAEPLVRSLRFDRAVGRGAAWAEGISAARGELVVAWEASRRYAAEDLPRLIARLSRADLIVGRRRRPWLARQVRRAALVPRQLLVGADVLDPHSPIWAARREAVVGLPLELGLEGWIAALVARRGYRVCELNIDYDASQSGMRTPQAFAPRVAEWFTAWHVCRQPQGVCVQEVATADVAASAPHSTDATSDAATESSRTTSLPGPWLHADSRQQNDHQERAA